ncbi:hypothetical protein GLOTRDRAFT_123734 [Gloeophyllum trabeum ATCC 11539]|uniref:Uncharacterized protein n=1 Tax=Gloeophyllum trabeum (strain ATCC 11539 / FP-39264 / Madison 617) TaxID=670483 RepID=S7QJV1_GLOTA|nr:uncharacterized protein GLOTRDRAFT_123734 [Gloeophyllum trabeum ATCC 11539]EPQ59976.1 hypothetical protein GLOTRDRAFT_123734 [Gloeophyllum trabeum ATCC 11539]
MEQVDRPEHMHFSPALKDRELAYNEGMCDIADAATGMARISDALFVGFAVRPEWDPSKPLDPCQIQVDVIRTRQWKMDGNRHWQETINKIIKLLQDEVAAEHILRYRKRAGNFLPHLGYVDTGHGLHEIDVHLSPRVSRGAVSATATPAGPSLPVPRLSPAAEAPATPRRPRTAATAPTSQNQNPTVTKALNPPQTPGPWAPPPSKPRPAATPCSRANAEAQTQPMPATPATTPKPEEPACPSGHATSRSQSGETPIHQVSTSDAKDTTAPRKHSGKGKARDRPESIKPFAGTYHPNGIYPRLPSGEGNMFRRFVERRASEQREIIDISSGDEELTGPSPRRRQQAQWSPESGQQQAVEAQAVRRQAAATGEVQGTFVDDPPPYDATGDIRMFGFSDAVVSFLEARKISIEGCALVSKGIDYEVDVWPHYFCQAGLSSDDAFALGEPIFENMDLDAKLVLGFLNDDDD